jgi:hypothetical protein
MPEVSSSRSNGERWIDVSRHVWCGHVLEDPPDALLIPRRCPFQQLGEPEPLRLPDGIVSTSGTRLVSDLPQRSAGRRVFKLTMAWQRSKLLLNANAVHVENG